MKIIADENIPYAKEAFEPFGEVCTLPGRHLSCDSLKDADMLLVRSVTQVNENLLKNSPVKFVASATIGTEHIDLEYLTTRRIGFGYAPGSNSQSVAEYIMATIFHWANARKTHLQGKVIGIIGAGSIGKKLPPLAKLFGINSIVCDPPRAREEGATSFSEMNYLLKHSDVITLHVPLNSSGEDKTLGLINKDFISHIKPKSLLINSSRGKVLDPNAIVDMLSSSFDFSFDVWPGEPTIDEALCLKAFLATPHIAGYSYNGKICGTEMIKDASARFFDISAPWTAKSVLKEQLLFSLDLRRSANPILDALLHAVPLIHDNARLKESMLLPREERGKRFDELRKRYAKRYEFCHYKILLNKEKEHFSEQFTALGFQTEVI